MSTLNPTVDLIAEAIAKRESGGNYGAIGKATSTGDKAYGKYQIMGSNIPQWSQEALGKPVDTKTFLSNPQIQDTVAKTKMAQLYNQYGNPQDVASAWFSGKPLAGNNAKDVNGTSTPVYVRDVTKNLGGQGGQNQTKISLQDFGKKIQAKYWQYANLDPAEVGRKVLAKYPQYGQYVDENAPNSPTTGTPSNPNGQPGFFQSMVQGIAKPFLQTGLGVARVAEGLGALASGDKQRIADTQVGLGNAHDFGYFGQVRPAGVDAQGADLSAVGSMEQGLGIGAQLGSYAIGGGEAGALGENVASHTIPSLIGAGAKTGAVVGGIAGAGQGLEQSASNNAGTLPTVANTLQGGVVGGLTGAVTGGILGGLGGVVGKVSGKLGTNKGLDETIASIQPDLTTKKLTQAYEKSAKNFGKSTIKEASLFGGPQSVGPSTDDIRLGTSLRSIGLDSKNPAGNLNKLNVAGANIENQIQPFNNFGISKGFKRIALNELENLKTNAPLETRGIKESETMFNKVVDYAKELLTKAKDNVGGYRNARTLFDQQAKLEFPNAYGDGGQINLKTPAGQAIFATRNALNDNLYSAAPTNSHLQNLISKEADIYKAIHNIAPKAAKLNGASVVKQVLARSPFLRKTLGFTKFAGTIGTGEGAVQLIKHFVSSPNQ